MYFDYGEIKFEVLRTESICEALHVYTARIKKKHQMMYRYSA